MDAREELVVPADLRKISESIKKLLAARMPGAAIYAVKVEESEDFDGDPILEITVIFDAASPLQAGKVAGVVRHIRSEILDQSDREFGYPVMSYISKKDAEKLGIEAQ